jgi:hypothetical protein
MLVYSAAHRNVGWVMPQTSVRKATRADHAPLIQSLARAF